MESVKKKDESAGQGIELDHSLFPGKFIFQIKQKMARIRRYGYVVEWFIGDHVPLHVHIYDSKGKFLGRLNVEEMRGVEGWMPDRKLVKLIQELQNEGRI